MYVFWHYGILKFLMLQSCVNILHLNIDRLRGENTCR